jgi:DNA helicase-2/ATP-dependent DNA helicase PcrA
MEAIDQIKERITEKKSFVLEAGAGAGKTYALIQTINYLIETKGADLKLNNQMIVCITYTNVAKNEIIERLENNPLILVSTIHEFLWDCIKLFNKQLIIEFDAINTLKHEEKPEKYSLGLAERIKSVEYSDRAFSDFEKGTVGHDDLILLAQKMFQNYELLTSIIASKYPYILVDEYQDTAPEIINAFLDFLLPRNEKQIVLGFYGDSHQKIYNTGVGSLQNYVDSKRIDIINKIENYRSSQEVIDLLNNVRSNIKQEIPKGAEKEKGSVQFINCINYPSKEKKQKVKEYEDSLIAQKSKNYDVVIADLESNGWEFGAKSEDKILIIANSRVARRSGFGNLYNVYNKRFPLGAADALIKREHPLTSLFVGSMDKKNSIERKTGIEHLIHHYTEGSFNEISSFLKRNGSHSVNLKKHSDKKVINEKIEGLITIRKTKSIKEVLEYVLENKLITLTKGMIRLQEKIQKNTDGLPDDEKTKIEKEKNFYDAVMGLPYKEVVALFGYTQNQNVFSTKHGTKGEEYRNVLVVIDDTSWKSQYKFEGYFDNSDASEDRKERTKNLFYVSCSRAKENLVVLALSKMEKLAMNNITIWFGDDNTFEIK